MNSLLNKVQSAALDLAMDYVLKDPAHNITRLLDVAETLDITGEHAGQLQTVRPMAENPDNTWSKFVVRLCNEIDADVLKTTVRNFFFNASVLGMQKQEKSRRKYGCNIPWAILIDPTSAGGGGRSPGWSGPCPSYGRRSCPLACPAATPARMWR